MQQLHQRSAFTNCLLILLLFQIYLGYNMKHHIVDNRTGQALTLIPYN